MTISLDSNLGKQIDDALQFAETLKNEEGNYMASPFRIRHVSYQGSGGDSARNG